MENYDLIPGLFRIWLAASSFLPPIPRLCFLHNWMIVYSLLPPMLYPVNTCQT